MGTQDTAQALTILGLVCNGFILLFEFLTAFYYIPFMFFIIIWFIVGFVLPIVAYNEIPKGSRGSAGTLLIISGIISLLFIFFISGILLIVAGALVASWNPYQVPRQRYDLQWVPAPSSYQGSAYLVQSRAGMTKKCVNCGVELDCVDQYCHVCGTYVGWY